MRFGRKSGSQDAGGAAEGAEPATSEEASDAAPATGPFDVADVDLEQRQHVDLGSLLITPAEGMDLQLQVDESSGQVLAVLLIGSEGALELRAFAASRGGGAWDELRPRIAAEMARMGGTADQRDGSFGTELFCVVPVTAPDGQPASQVSRVVGHEGSAWLLRATLMGRPALDADLAGPWEDTIRQVVVRRGREAMAPGTPLPLTLPPEARRVQ